MGKYGRHLDSIDPLGRQNRIKREQDRKIREMRAEKRLASSTVEEGGALTVAGVLEIIGSLDLTGDLSMKDGTGTEMIRMGDMTYGRGLEFKRSDGSQAFRFRKSLSTSAVENWALTDSAGNSIVSEEPLAAALRRPFLELPFQPYAATSGTAVSCGPYGFERTTASASWETLFMYDGKAQNLLIDFKFAAKCSDATTAAELQVIDLDTGTPRPGYFLSPWVGSVPAGTTTMTTVDPTPDKVLSTVASVLPGGYMRLGVQARIVAGTGSVTLAVPQAMGGAV